MPNKIVPQADFVNRIITVNEDLIDDVLACPDDLKKVIKELNLGETPRQLLNRLRQACNDGGEFPNEVKGLSGFATILFLEAFNGRFSQKENCPDEIIIEEENKEFRTKVSGKICDYVFIPDEEDPNKMLQTGSGHLSVEVFQEQFDSNQALRDCKPDKTAFYHWDIGIRRYEIHKRYDLLENPSHDNFPDKPFPTLADKEPDMKFPPFSLDENDARSIWCRGLNHKLFAKGKDIVVENVYRQICHHSSPEKDEIFHLLDKGDPTIKNLYYDQNSESCVDIMFKGYPPLAILPEQRSYCLGRCDKPAIVNSGN